MCKPTGAPWEKTAPAKKDDGDGDGDGDDSATTATKKKNAGPPITLARFWDRSENWLLVESGSFNGHFDNIPSHFRVGPWNSICCLYLFGLCSWIGWNVAECYSNPPAGITVENTFAHYHDTDTWQWKCNAAGFLWTLFIAHKVTKTDLGWGAWVSYTLQSWTLIVVRFGLSTMAPFAPSLLAPLAEYLRFATLLQTTVTFGIWNFVLFPVVLATMKTSRSRSDFVKWCFGFLLSQLHLFNLPLAALSGIYGSPVRELNKVDFCVALAFALQYVLFYLFVLDRIGAHLYFIFSPRSPLALLSWSMFIGCIHAGFSLWNGILQQYLLQQQQQQQQEVEKQF